MCLSGFQPTDTPCIESIHLQTMRGRDRSSRLNSICSLPHIWATSALGFSFNPARGQAGKAQDQTGQASKQLFRLIVDILHVYNK